MRILLVEDDTIIGDGINVALKKQGFCVDWLEDGALAKDGLLKDVHELVILDLTLPNIDGLTLLEYWRKKNIYVPVLILTARGSVTEKVEGLNLGADDYLAKPFALVELIARVRALQRRHGVQNDSILKHKDISFDVNKRLVTKNDENVLLSPKAMILLEILMTSGNAVLSKSLLEEKLYGWSDDVSSNTVEVHIHALRSKLGKESIKTVHGVGYTLG